MAIAVALLVLNASAIAGPLDMPIAMTIVVDGSPLRGKIVSVDEATFGFESADGQTAAYPWQQLPASRVLAVHSKVLERNDGVGWFRLAMLLFEMDDGQTAAESALRRATAADPTLEEQAQKLRNGEPVNLDGPIENNDPNRNADGPEHDHGGSGESGPVSVGEIQSRFWGPLPAELMASSVEELKGRAEATQQAMNLRLVLYEKASDYFLFYTDLPADEAVKWAGLLDRMYDRLCETFGIEKGTNIFRGKALIYVFRNQQDYHRFHSDVQGRQGTENTGGLCVSYGNGHVEISFYRPDDEMRFAHVLVHEAVHGFVHRYRNHPHVVSWANEGLAEYIASNLVPQRRASQDTLRYVQQELEQRGSLGGDTFWGENNIQGWQYPVAQLMCEFMIAQDKQRYKAFINAIKDGKPWPQALEEDYGVTPERLAFGFGSKIGVRNLRP